MTITREVQLKVFRNDDDDAFIYYHWGHLTKTELESIKKAVEQITGRKGERYD